MTEVANANSRHPADNRQVSERREAVTVSDVLAEATARLAPVMDQPRLEAEILLADVLKVGRSAFRARPERTVEPDPLDRFRQMIVRRGHGVPSAYLTGRREFWSLAFEVDESVLIPRHETECLVEAALAALPTHATARVADIGTGCGAVAAALALERPGCRILATDISLAALAVAQRNISRIGLRNVTLAAGRWLSCLRDGCVDLLISNPPYVADGDPHLRRDDAAHEPRIALAAGPDGLDALRVLATGSRRCLRPGGHLMLEHGYDQGPAVRELIAASGYGAIVTHRDYAGHERITQARCPA